MKWCLHKVKGERDKRQVDQTQTTRYVLRFEHPALHPRLHHREGFIIHYTPTEGTSTEEDLLQQWSTELLSQTPPHNRGVSQQPTPLPKMFTTNSNSTSPRGSKQQSPPLLKRKQINHPINLYQRGIQQGTRVFTTSGYKDHKLSFLSSFPQNKILID